MQTNLQKPLEKHTTRLTAKLRHKIAKETYKKAINNGDKNIYFIDGTILRDDIDFDYGTTDNSHPNDVGFYKIATLVKPIFNKIFNKI